MEEELPYFEEFLTDITVVDARDPSHCLGYPACSSCACTDRVRPKGGPILDHLRGLGGPEVGEIPVEGRPTRWLGWRGVVTPEESERNRSGRPG